MRQKNSQLLLPSGDSIFKCLSSFSVGTDLSKSIGQEKARSTPKIFKLIRNFQWEKPERAAALIIKKAIENEDDENIVQDIDYDIDINKGTSSLNVNESTRVQDSIDALKLYIKSATKVVKLSKKPKVPIGIRVITERAEVISDFTTRLDHLKLISDEWERCFLFGLDCNRYSPRKIQKLLPIQNEVAVPFISGRQRHSCCVKWCNNKSGSLQCVPRFPPEFNTDIAVSNRRQQI